MQVITNTKIIENRALWAKRITPVSIVLLLSGLFTNLTGNNQPDMARLSLILVTLGFILSFVTSNLVNRWVREPRADQILTTALKGFGKEYVLFNYTEAASHIFLTPQGLYVMAVRKQDGEITVKERRFARKFNWRQLLNIFVEESVGYPINEVEKDVDKLRQFLQKNSEEVPPIQPLVIFSNEQVKLTLNNPPVPVLYSKELKNYLRKFTKQAITAPQRDKLTEIIGAKYKIQTKEI